MVYRARGPSPRSEKGPRTFAFRSATARHGLDRFELAFWDYTPTMWVVVSLFTGGALALRVLRDLAPLWMFAAALSVVILGCIDAKNVLVATRASTYVERRVFGIRWKRIDLGRLPKVVFDLAYDWSELAVVPSDPARSVGLHDGARFVFAEWSAHLESKDREAAHLADIANRAVAGLQGFHPAG